MTRTAPMYGGRYSIDADEAQLALAALAPILDSMAALPAKVRDEAYRRSVFRAKHQALGTCLGTDSYRTIENDRWALWRTVQVLLASLERAGLAPENPQREAVRSRRYGSMMTTTTKSGDMHGWWDERCGRPTRKGEPCKAKLRFGRVACRLHATDDDNRRTRIWQDAVHLPYPRVECDGPTVDVTGVTNSIKRMMEGLE